MTLPTIPIPSTNGVVKHSYEELAAQVTELTNQLESVRNELEKTTQALSSTEHDFLVLNRALNEEAVDRDWCNEYENVVSRVQSNLLRMEIEPRFKEFTVRVRVETTYYASVTVDAVDSDDALERVGNWDTSDILDDVDLTDYDDIEWETTDAHQS